MHPGVGVGVGQSQSQVQSSGAGGGILGGLSSGIGGLFSIGSGGRDKYKILLVIDDPHTDWSKYFRGKRLPDDLEIRVEQVFDLFCPLRNFISIFSILLFFHFRLSVHVIVIFLFSFFCLHYDSIFGFCSFVTNFPFPRIPFCLWVFLLIFLLKIVQYI